MKNLKVILSTFAATTIVYAASFYGLLHFEAFFLLSAAQMNILQENFTAIYNEGYKYFQLFQMCKNAT